MNTPNIIALFTFVARDPTTQKATKINKLVPQTSEQQIWFDERAQAAHARKAARKAAETMGASGGVGGTSNLENVAKRRAWTQRLLSEARLMNRMPGVSHQFSSAKVVLAWSQLPWIANRFASWG